MENDNTHLCKASTKTIVVNIVHWNCCNETKEIQAMVATTLFRTLNTIIL